jgi:hypothetical protein
VAVLVDVDRDRRAALQLGAALVVRAERLLAVLDAELGELRQRLERLVERPVLVHVHLQRHARDGTNGAHALDVEPVAAAELQLQPLEAAARLLGLAGRLVRVSEAERPGGRRARAREAEQAPDGDVEQLSAQVVERPVERRLRGELAPRQPREDLLEREGVVAERVGDVLQVRERGRGSLLVTVDGRRLAVAGDAVVLELDPDDVGGVL